MNSLKNKLLLITKSRQDAEQSLIDLINAGMDIIYFPTIKIIPIISSPVLNDALDMFSEFNYLIFTSANAVNVFNAVAKNRQLEFSKVKVTAIGKSTQAKCRHYEIDVDILPDEYSAKGMIDKFSSIDITNQKIFIPGSSLSSSELEKGLTELGAQVVTAPIYDVIINDQNNLQDEVKRIKVNKPDIFAFTSPSSFNNFLEIIKPDDLNEYFVRNTICAIGTTTEEAIRNKGLTVHIVPGIFSIEGIAEAIKKYFHITANMA